MIIINTNAYNKETYISHILSNLLANLFRLDLPKTGPTYGRKWLSNGITLYKDSQSQNLKHACRVS